MRYTFLTLITLSLAGCSFVTDGSAEDCDVSSVEFDKAVNEVSQLRPYSSRQVGTCELHVNDAEFVHVITQEDIERINAEENSKAER